MRNLPHLTPLLHLKNIQLLTPEILLLISVLHLRNIPLLTPLLHLKNIPILYLKSHSWHLCYIWRISHSFLVRSDECPTLDTFGISEKSPSPNTLVTSQEYPTPDTFITPEKSHLRNLPILTPLLHQGLTHSWHLIYIQGSLLQFYCYIYHRPRCICHVYKGISHTWHLIHLRIIPLLTLTLHCIWEISHL